MTKTLAPLGIGCTVDVTSSMAVGVGPEGRDADGRSGSTAVAVDRAQESGRQYGRHMGVGLADDEDPKEEVRRLLRNRGALQQRVRRRLQMQHAVAKAVERLGQPVTPEEEAAGWTPEQVAWTRELAERWRSRLRNGAAASTLGNVNLARAFDGGPGSAFDPRQPDERRHVLLGAGMEIANVQAVDAVREQALRLRIVLEEPSRPLTKELPPEAAHAIRDGLQELLDVFDNGDWLTTEVWERWRDTLGPAGARWRLDDVPPLPGLPSGPHRLWQDQPGELWERLGRIDRLLEQIVLHDRDARSG